MKPLFGARASKRSACTRIFFATDVHGSERCFRKWVNAALVYGVQAIILGGDVSGKAIVPVISRPLDWRAELYGEEVIARDEAELEALRKKIRSLGFYDVMLSEEEAASLEGTPEKDALFRSAMEESLTRWVRLCDERLGGSGITVAMMLGNDDDPALADVIRSSATVVYAEDGVITLPGGFHMISTGYSTPTPWHTPRELDEDALARVIEHKVADLAHPETAIFNFHCPPWDSHLDQAPELGADLKPVVGAAGQAMTPVGSRAVREALERYQPFLGLHGHVHESPGIERFGRTVSINPGSDYGQGTLRGALVELTSDGVASWQLVQG